MWNFISGVNEPPPKKAKSSSEKKERDKEYESKRKRNFQTAWLKRSDGEDRSWLIFDKEVGLMHCTHCRKYATGDKNRQSGFVKGTDNFKYESIKLHEDSQLHTDSCKKVKAAEKPRETEGALLLRQLNKQQIEKMTVLFRNAHALAKRGKPFSDFEWICE